MNLSTTNFSSLKGKLPLAEFQALKKMQARIAQHSHRHWEREKYYDGTNALKDLGIALPPSLRGIEVALGWPQIGIDRLSDRINIEGYALPDGDPTDYEIDQIVWENRLDVEASAIHTSALLHGCAFIATFLGDTSRGEPPVIIQAFDARHATGLYRPTSRDLGASLIYVDENYSGITRALLMFPHAVYSLTKSEAGSWDVQGIENNLGYVPVQVVAFNSSLNRPFGKSRLSRAMMYTTDAAMRCVARAEVSAEFFSAPQRYILGADSENFLDEEGNPLPAWDLMLGRMMIQPYNEDADQMPQVGQFDAESPTPHRDLLEMWAGQFSAQTGIPLTTLGVMQTNPASAEGLYASNEGLLITAHQAQRDFSSAWVRTMQTAVQLRHNLSELPDDLKRLTIRWADPSTPSRAQAADATMKLVSAGILPAASEVTLELAGLSQAQVVRIKAEQRAAQAPSRLTELLANKTQVPELDESEKALKDANVLKTKGDALGLLRRAGVTAEDAARLVGLEGISFIPGNPITVKAPEEA